MIPSGRSSVAAAVLIVTTLSVLAAPAAQSETGPVNAACPFTGRPVTADSPTVSYRGYTIGFCCGRCQSRWAGSSEETRNATLARFVETTSPSTPAADGLSLARAYLAAMQEGQLDAMNRLFLPDGRSSILENASDEGSWEHYRDHHLKPELEAASNFQFTVTDEKEERFGSTSLVRQVGTFRIQIEGEARTYRMAVTYVIVSNAGEPRIAHLHWSSRPKPGKLDE